MISPTISLSIELNLDIEMREFLKYLISFTLIIIMEKEGKKVSLFKQKIQKVREGNSGENNGFPVAVKIVEVQKEDKSST